MKRKKQKKFNIRILLLIIIAILACLIINPFNLVKGNLAKLSLLAEQLGGGNTITTVAAPRTTRYWQSETENKTYVGLDGEFDKKVTLPETEENTQLLSYEDVVYERKADLYIAEMGILPYLDYSGNYQYRKQWGYDLIMQYKQKLLSGGTLTKEEKEEVDLYDEFTKLDSTITKSEVSVNIPEKSKAITREETILEKTGNNLYGNPGTLIAKTRTLALYNTYKNAKIITVGDKADDLSSGEAYLLACARSTNEKNLNVDKIQQALWRVKYGIKDRDIDKRYIGINFESKVVAQNYYEEAQALNDYLKYQRELKQANNGQEIVDNMLNINGEDKYKEGEAGLVSYDEKEKEFLAGPFSVNYIRQVLVPEKGGQNQTQNKDGMVIFSAITDSKLYGLKNGKEELVQDWEFVYTDVEYNIKEGKAQRIAEKAALGDGDKSPNVYPYPNEVFYIKFKDTTFDAISKLEFTMKTMNAEAEAYVLDGKYHDVSWTAQSEGGQSYLQMTPSWKEIGDRNILGKPASKLYQLKSARILDQQKTIRLSLGNYHEKYSDYCIPLTMDFAGQVWYDGTEVEQYTEAAKVFGTKDAEEKGIPDVNVYLYDINDKLIQRTTTDKDGKYKFTYVKVSQKYYVEFEYDGMKYKATTYLNGENGRGNYQYEFPKYLAFSHAKEVVTEREAFNNQFYEIKNGSGRNDGQAISENNRFMNISYTTEGFDKEYTGSVATVQKFNCSARTKTTDVIYPLHNSYIITNKDLSEVDLNQNKEELDKLELYNTFVLGKRVPAKNEYYTVNTLQGEQKAGITEKDEKFITESTIKYTKIVDYLQNINLGLIERVPSDFAIKNDVTQTNFTQFEKVSDANILDFNQKPKDPSTFDITARTEGYFNTPYTQDIDYDKYIARFDYTNNNKTIKNDESQLYVQYKLTICNQSELLSGYITELSDFYEKDLYYPVDTDEVWRYYDKDKNYMVDKEKGYADITLSQFITKTSWAIKNEGKENREELGQVKWSSNSKFGADNNKNMENTSLNAMYTNSLANIKLAKDETVDIYIIFKVERMENSNYGGAGDLYISNDNATEGKRNIAEINSYRALNYDGSNGGRIDIDSAPGNSDLGNVKDGRLGNIVTYEDDIDQAPFLKAVVTNKDNGKGISGYVWKDEADKVIPYMDKEIMLGEKLGNNQRIGDGKININDFTNKSFEDYINNVKVELVRLEYDKTDGQYKEVEFTEKYKQAYGEKYNEIYPGTDVEDNKGKSGYEIMTWTGPYGKNADATKPINTGEYRFDNLIESGKYKVRFKYGSEEQLRTDFRGKDATIYSGHDYMATKLTNGRIDVKSIPDPKTEVIIIVDSGEILKKEKNPIINTMKNLVSDIKEANANIKVTVLDYGRFMPKIRTNLDDLGKMTAAEIADNMIYSAAEGIYTAKNMFASSDANNKIMILYNDGFDHDTQYVKENLKKSIDEGIEVIGVGLGSESLDVFRTKGANGGKPAIYTLNEEVINNYNVEQGIYNIVMNKIIKQNYLIEQQSHAEDYMQNTKITTMNGNTRDVRGRLEIMKYSQKMDWQIADVLNTNHIKTLRKDLNKDSEWSQAIKELARNTEMTADTHPISIDFRDNKGKVQELNLGLQEIPERKTEVNNEVDNIVITLANNKKIVDLKNGTSQNVQIIPENLFSIYMDEELMQGAKVEVTYRINISNIGNVDTLYSYVKYANEAEKKSWYKALTGEDIPNGENTDEFLSKTEPMRVMKVYSYYDNLLFRAEENNNWEIINKKVASNNGIDVIRDADGDLTFKDEDIIYKDKDAVRKEKTKWSLVGNLELLERTKNKASKYSIIETTSFDNIYLYPNKSKEIEDGDKTKTSTICTYLKLSKTLSAQDMDLKDALSYKNFAEVIKTESNTGRRDYNGSEANFNPNSTVPMRDLVTERDIEAAERIIILPPFGDKKIYYVLIATSMVILIGGIIFVRKKVL